MYVTYRMILKEKNDDRRQKRMREEPRVDELLSALRRVENRLMILTHIRVALPYLLWGLAMTVFFAIGTITAIVGVNEATKWIISIVYWVPVAVIILRYTAKLNKMVAKVLGAGRKSSKQSCATSVIGWVLGIIVWAWLSNLTGDKGFISGFLFFLGAGNASVLVHIWLAARAIVPSIAVASCFQLMLSVIITFIPDTISIGLVYSLAFSLALTTYMGVAAYHLYKALHTIP